MKRQPPNRGVTAEETLIERGKDRGIIGRMDSFYMIHMARFSCRVPQAVNSLREAAACGRFKSEHLLLLERCVALPNLNECRGRGFGLRYLPVVLADSRPLAVQEVHLRRPLG